MVRDSALKQRVASLIRNSLAQYDNRVASHREWIQLLKKKELYASDLFVLLKITRTMQAMEHFQRTNIPALSSFRQLGISYDDLVKQTERLTNKQP